MPNIRRIARPVDRGIGRPPEVMAADRDGWTPRSEPVNRRALAWPETPKSAWRFGKDANAPSAPWPAFAGFHCAERRGPEAAARGSVCGALPRCRAKPDCAVQTLSRGDRNLHPLIPLHGREDRLVERGGKVKESMKQSIS